MVATSVSIHNALSYLAFLAHPHWPEPFIFDICIHLCAPVHYLGTCGDNSLFPRDSKFEKHQFRHAELLYSLLVSLYIYTDRR